MIDYERVFSDSYRRILDSRTSVTNEFFDAFYERFIAASPLVAEKFANTDMAAQKAMLKQSIAHLANVSATKEIPDSLREIARKHSKKAADIPSELYQLWLDCLVKTAREFDPKFNDEAELSWRMICSQGIAFMTYMYDKP